MAAIWEMVKEAVETLGREASYAEIKALVCDKHGEINQSSMTCSIISASVNHPSRIHYQENKKPRICTGGHDFLFNTGRGKVAPYNAAIHGVWEIYKKDDGQLGVRKQEGSEEQEPPQEADNSVDGSLFALEAHLRDYLARNMQKQTGFSSKLKVYTAEDGRDGVEFQTDVGPIDILCVDEADNFVVLELKLGKSADACLGQILRYMGWVKMHLAGDKKVKGVIVAAEIPIKMKYAVSQVPSVSVMEYELTFALKPAPLVALS